MNKLKKFRYADILKLEDLNLQIIEQKLKRL